MIYPRRRSASRRRRFDGAPRALRPATQAAGLRRRRPLLSAAELDDARRGAGRAAVAAADDRTTGLQPAATARPRAAVRRRIPVARGPGLRARRRRATAPDRDHAALGHRRRLLPLSRQGQGRAARRGRRATRARRAMPGRRDQARRLLRRPGGVLSTTCWRDVPVAAAPGTREVTARGDLPGLRRCGPLLPADPQDACRCRSATGAPRRRRPRPPQRARSRSEQDTLRRHDPHGSLLTVVILVLRRGPAARVHALRAADGADPLRASSSAPAATDPSRAGARSRCRLPTCSAWRSPTRSPAPRSRAAGTAGAGVLPAAVDHRRCSRRCSCCSRSACSACSTCRCRRPSSRGIAEPEQPAAAGHARRHGGHGRAVVAHRHRLRRAAAGRARWPSSARRGDVLRGGAALFSLSLGMGAPLLVVGASAGQLLPKAGPWMDASRPRSA